MTPKVLLYDFSGQTLISAYNYLTFQWYSAGIGSWTLEESRQLDCGTCKLLSLHGVFYRTSDVDCLYIAYHPGGRGLVSIVTLSRQRNMLQEGILVQQIKLCSELWLDRTGFQLNLTLVNNTWLELNVIGKIITLEQLFMVSLHVM